MYVKIFNWTNTNKIWDETLYYVLVTDHIAPLEMVALATSRIYLMIYLIYITNIDKFKFLCKRVGCEAQEGAE